VLVWDTDWSGVSWHSAEPARMRRILRAWDDHLAHPSLPRVLAASLRAAGFTEIRAEGHAFVTTELDGETFGGNSLERVEQYLAGRTDVDGDEARAWAEEQRTLGARGEYFFGIIQFCFTATRH